MEEIKIWKKIAIKDAFVALYCIFKYSILTK